MLKERKKILLGLVTLLLLTTFNSYEGNAEIRNINSQMHRPLFGSYFKEPIIIEKEVVVYVDKEPEVESETVEEYSVHEEIVTQPLNYYFNIFEPTNYSYDDIYKALDTAPHSGLQHLIPAFIDAEDIYGVNALYLLSTIGWESGWGRYHSGFNNIAGWKGGPGGTWSDFDSEYECIMTVAESLSTYYKDSVGPYLIDVTGMYCPDPGYRDNILQIMGEMESEILY